jgi:hypothetical protein
VYHVQHGERKEKESENKEAFVAARCARTNWKQHFKSSPFHDSQTQTLHVFTSSRCVKAKVNEFDYLLGVARKKKKSHAHSRANVSGAQNESATDMRENTT